LAPSLLTTGRPNFSATGATTAGATQYWFLGNAVLNPSTTEINRRTTWRSPGVISKLLVKIIANTASLSSTLYVRKNGIDTSLGVTIASGFVGIIQQTIDTVTIAAGDTLVYKTVSGGTGTIQFVIMSVIFDATTNTITREIAMGRAATTSGTTQYAQISGDRSGTSAVEANLESRIKKPGTFKYAYLYISANARTTTTPVTLRKNRTDTGITWNVTAGFTGPLENTNTPIIVAAEDEVDWKIVYAVDANNITIEMFAIDFESDDNYTFISAGSTGASSDITIDFGTTNYFSISGAMRENPTEAETRYPLRLPLQFSNLSIHGQVNTLNGATNIRVRKNGAYVNESITIGAGVQTWHADDVNIDNAIETDEVTIEVACAGTSGTLTIRNMGIWAKYIAPVPELTPQIGYGGGRRFRPEPYKAKLAEPLKKIVREPPQLVTIPFVIERLLLDEVPSLRFELELGQIPEPVKEKKIVIKRENLSAPIKIPLVFERLLLTEGNSIELEFEAALMANASPANLELVYNKLLTALEFSEQDKKRKARLRRFRKLLKLLPF
jgi:hypothetical protein